MTKIKNFKITLRAHETARMLKARTGVQMTPEIEALVEHEIKDQTRRFAPAAVYTTLTAERSLTAGLVGFPPHTLSVSVLAVTVGDDLRPLIGAARDKGDTFRAHLLEALGQEALARAVQLVLRLVQEEAKTESCDLSETRGLEAGPIRQALLQELAAERVGIREDGSALTPVLSRVAWVAWLPVGRRSDRALSSSKTLKRADVPEKVAPS